MFKKLRLKFRYWLSLGLCITLLSACWGSSTYNPNSFKAAEKVLSQKILPKIELETVIIPDEVAVRYTPENLAEPLPELDKFPLYGAKPTHRNSTVYLEIFSSSEKANAKKQDERWLVDVVEKFNQQQFFTRSGELIQVGVRDIPSGIAQRLIAAQAAQPAGYTPSHELWLKMLESEEINPVMISFTLLPSHAGFVIQNQLKQEISPNGEVTFEQVLDAILAGKLTIGYTNPFTSSTGLNLLYTLFWQAAGHNHDGQPLTRADLNSPQVRSVFDAFQKQVLITALTTPDLKEIFIRNPQKLPAFAIDYPSYSTLKKLPEFAQTSYIPFGVPHNSPLVGFEWNTPTEQEALEIFADFATSPEMQKLDPQARIDTPNYLQRSDVPPLPTGEVLTRSQSFWKRQKDSGRTVYLMNIIDTSGSMEGEPLQAVKEGLRIASHEINSGNYIGLITYSERPTLKLPLAPFDTLQHQRLLATIDSLKADGHTAMYDAMMVALSELMKYKKTDPDGRFYLLVLTDGQTNKGLNFNQIREIINQSGVRVYPIAYGDVNQVELEEIAALRESTVKTGTTENIQSLLKDLFQTNL